MQYGCLEGYALVYKCIICGREWEKGQSLRAHLKVHRGQMARFSVRIPKNLRDDFKELCRAHGVTTCHVVVGLMSACVEGFRRGVVFEWDARSEGVRFKEGSNPLIVNFNQTFTGKPRSPYKLEVPDEALGSPRDRCPECGSRDVYQQMDPFGSSFRSGRCRKCRAEWCVNPF